MTLTGNIAWANAMLDGIGQVMGGASLSIRTGSAPGASNAATGTVLATIVLPPTPMSPAASGLKQKAGLWYTSALLASGTAGHWRMVTTTGAVLEGGVGIPASGADLEITNGLGTLVLTMATGLGVQVTSFQLRTPFI